jgi:hypothetical protein
VVAWDEDGNVQVVECEVCAGEASLEALARTRLAAASKLHTRDPALGFSAVG